MFRYDFLDSFIQRHGGPGCRWAVGITDDPDQWLKNHAVRMDADRWLVANADSFDIARQASNYLVANGVQDLRPRYLSSDRHLVIYRVEPHTLEFR